MKPKHRMAGLYIDNYDSAFYLSGTFHLVVNVKVLHYPKMHKLYDKLYFFTEILLTYLENFKILNNKQKE